MKLDIKHPEYGQFGKLEKSAEQDLLRSTNKLPNRVDFQPNVRPNVKQGQNKPDVQQQKRITDKCLEILGQIFVDGKPLSELYDWEMNISSFNPHGWGMPNWKYYMVGMLKKPGTVLKEMITEAVLELMNSSTDDLSKKIESKLTKLFQLAPSFKTDLKELKIEKQQHGSMAALVLIDSKGNRVPLLSNTAREACDKMIPVVSDLVYKLTGKQANKSPTGGVTFD